MKNKIYNIGLLKKDEYLKNFNNELSEKKILNRNKKDIFNMSIKRPLPIDNYDYLMFNFIPKIHKELFIKDLTKINKRYLYKYLIGKIISELYWDDYIFFLIEDKNKDIIPISIYHFENKYYPLQIDYLENNFLSKGKYLLFINPWFTFEHYEEILCLTTNEFIVFDNYEEILYFIKINNEDINEENLMKIGDLMIEKNRYDKSIYYYEKAIKINEKKKDNGGNASILLKLLYKISFSYLNYEYFSKVLFYCDYGMKIIKNNFNNNNSLNDNIIELKSKMFCIKIKGLIGLRKFKEGFEYYEKYKEDNDIKKIIELDIDNIKLLINEIILKKDNQNGIYKFKEMLLDEEKQFYLNYGDYINSKIKIHFDDKKGLKLICKNNNIIKTGELIIVEKALVCKKNEENIEKKRMIGLNISNDDNNRNEEPYQNLEMTNELMEKIKKYKEDYQIFFILYDEENKKLNIEERKKLYLNGEEKRIGFEKVKKIIDNSKYSAIRSILYENKKGFGLWGYTSIINHSCNPNINNFSIGDFMICFATKDISEGEELTTLYINNSSYYLLRQKKCFENWGFHCSCEICIYDQININNNLKKYYENSFKEFYEIGNNILFHKKINDKYILFENILVKNKNEFSSFDLANGYLQLIYHYGVLNDFNKCKELSEFLSVITDKNNYYIFELQNLNIIFGFFGYKDENNIFKYLIKRYEILIKKYTFLNKEDFDELIKSTLK